MRTPDLEQSELSFYFCFTMEHFPLDSFRFRPAHYPRRWTKVSRSSISFCFYCAFLFCQNKLLRFRFVFLSIPLSCISSQFYASFCKLQRILNGSCNSASSVIINCLDRNWMYLSCERSPAKLDILLKTLAERAGVKKQVGRMMQSLLVFERY